MALGSDAGADGCFQKMPTGKHGGKKGENLIEGHSLRWKRSESRCECPQTRWSYIGSMYDTLVLFFPNLSDSDKNSLFGNLAFLMSLKAFS